MFFVSLSLRAKLSAMVIGPIRPANMRTIKVILLIIPKDVVRCALIPTVVMAETDSNIKIINSTSGFNKDKIPVPNKKAEKKTEKMTNAFRTSVSEIV